MLCLWNASPGLARRYPKQRSRVECCSYVFTIEWEISCEQSGLKAVLNFSETKRANGWFGGGEFVNEVSGFVWSAKVGVWRGSFVVF